MNSLQELEEEGNSLNSKYVKLVASIKSKAWSKIQPHQQALMLEQKSIMAEYLAVLANRIKQIKGN